MVQWLQYKYIADIFKQGEKNHKHVLKKNNNNLGVYMFMRLSGKTSF